VPTGISLHIGVSEVDPGQYTGANKQLDCGESDAKFFRQIAETNGFSAISLMTPAANTTDVASSINRAACSLDRGDMFFLTFSGHGGPVVDPDKTSAHLQDAWLWSSHPCCLRQLL